MSFDWTTFGLEAVNFLILVWILKRLLYRPVLDAIEARRTDSERRVAEAEALRGQAEAMHREYEARIAAWERESGVARVRLDGEIAAERSKRLAVLGEELEEERKRREVLEARAQAEGRRVLERQAVATGAKFVARLLEGVADPGLEARLVDLALRELDALPPSKAEALRTALQESRVGVRVVTAYRLDEGRRTAFEHALSRLAARPVAPVFAEDPVLQAGACVMAGSWVMMANLRDELSFFSEMFDHGG
jgi:F-type H+-transporting ATPase subunit b